MPYVITELCVRDGSCVEVCPVACIHTTPEAPQFYIDPDICIECEQCEVVCPVDAIWLHSELPDEYAAFDEVNASFFRKNKAVVEPVSLEHAWRMVELAQDFAANAGMAVSVAVVDPAGSPVAMGRMNDALPRTAELAFNKAYTAIAFQLPTQAIGQETRRPWFPSLVISHNGHIMGGGGGIPIVEDAVIIGAIGVAGGATNEQDILCSRAGLAVYAHH